MSAWLLDAPPWSGGAASSRDPQTRGGQKRNVDQISDAENALGKLAWEFANRVRMQGWRRTIEETRGRSNIPDTVDRLPHRAARLLNHLGRRGANVPLRSRPWTRSECDKAVVRGSHQSSQGEREFVANEILDFVRQGYWVVLPADDAMTLEGLRISPLGVVPQYDRRPRLIVDYTFSGVNDDTIRLATPEAMQFGRALQRVFTTLVHAHPRYGPVYLAKIDIADGFYRVWLNVADIPRLGVILPTAPGATPLIAFPLALPMGWVESPPYFTAVTETACDLANAMLRSRPSACLQQVHRLERVAATPPADADVSYSPGGGPDLPSPLHGAGRPPVSAVDVYVDDFLLMAQTAHQRTKVLRATLRAIDKVLRPLDDSDSPHRKEPSSITKMAKGDACWSTRKRILGWDLDTEALTLHLPPRRMARLQEVLSWLLPPHKRLHVRKWHQVLGELRSMSPAVPGSRGLFSVLQEALRHTDKRRVRIDARTHDLARDFLALVHSVHARPTRLAELVPTAPSDIGASDACRVGMGGVWFDALDSTSPPILWRQRFPQRLSQALITAENPSGTISISDLELAGVIAHQEVVCAARDVSERTLWIASDNRAAVSWATKGSSTSVAARSHLLRLSALHQRAHRYVARHHYIPGPVNAMADDASRRWDLTDDQLLTHFNSTYPQATSWQLQTLTSAINASLNGALFKKRATLASLLSVMPPPPPRGGSGRPSVPAWESTPTARGASTPSLFSSSSRNDIALAPSRPDVNPSALARWRKPYERWARRTPDWGPLTLAA
jgi:hypothetical protein